MTERPEPQAPLLAVRGLTVQFGSRRGAVTVVDDVDLDLRPGEIVGLVGESGSGKTMTGLAVMGLLPPGGRVTAGSVRFDGRELLGLPQRELRAVRGREIGMIFQEPRRSLDPNFTVGDQVAEALAAHEPHTRAQRWAAAVEMLDRVRIPDAARRARDYPHQLSGGQCQRVMLAIALVCRPRVLLADEPTTALDVTVQAEMLRLLDELRRDLDLAVLLVTHDLGVVAEMCDRVEVMYAGQVVELASTVDLFDRPRHPYTSGLLGSVLGAGSGRRLPSIPGRVPSPSDLPEGCRLRPRCAHATEECRAPQPLVRIGVDRSARCSRIHDLALPGV